MTGKNLSQRLKRLEARVIRGSEPIKLEIRFFSKTNEAVSSRVIKIDWAHTGTANSGDCR